MDSPSVEKRRRSWREPETFQYLCASGALLTSIFNAAGLASAEFLPPISPFWDAQRTANHYRTHEKGVQVGASLILFSTIFSYRTQSHAQRRWEGSRACILPLPRFSSPVVQQVRSYLFCQELFWLLHIIASIETRRSHRLSTTFSGSCTRCPGRRSWSKVLPMHTP